MRLVGVLTPGVCPLSVVCFVSVFIQVVSVSPVVIRMDAGQWAEMLFRLGDRELRSVEFFFVSPFWCIDLFYFYFSLYVFYSVVVSPCWGLYFVHDVSDPTFAIYLDVLYYFCLRWLLHFCCMSGTQWCLHGCSWVSPSFHIYYDLFVGPLLFYLLPLMFVWLYSKSSVLIVTHLFLELGTTETVRLAYGKWMAYDEFNDSKSSQSASYWLWKFGDVIVGIRALGFSFLGLFFRVRFWSHYDSLRILRMGTIGIS